MCHCPFDTFGLILIYHPACYSRIMFEILVTASPALNLLNKLYWINYCNNDVVKMHGNDSHPILTNQLILSCSIMMIKHICHPLNSRWALMTLIWLFSSMECIDQIIVLRTHRPLWKIFILNYFKLSQLAEKLDSWTSSGLHFG